MPLATALVDEPVLYLLDGELRGDTQTLLLVSSGIRIIHVVFKPFRQHPLRLLGDVRPRFGRPSLLILRELHQLTVVSLLLRPLLHAAVQLFPKKQVCPGDHVEKETVDETTAILFRKEHLQ